MLVRDQVLAPQVQLRVQESVPQVQVFVQGLVPPVQEFVLASAHPAPVLAQEWGAPELEYVRE